MFDVPFFYLLLSSVFLTTHNRAAGRFAEANSPLTTFSSWCLLSVMINLLGGTFPPQADLFVEGKENLSNSR